MTSTTGTRASKRPGSLAFHSAAVRTIAPHKPAAAIAASSSTAGCAAIAAATLPRSSSTPGCPPPACGQRRRAAAHRSRIKPGGRAFSGASGCGCTCERGTLQREAQ
jgi:hypothetical protein